MGFRFVPCSDEDKTYFRQLNEHAYRTLVVQQFGYWDSDIQGNNFETKWLEQEFQKIYVDDLLIGGIWVQEFQKYHQLREIQLWPDFRNQGFGTRLVEAEIQKAKLAGKELHLRVLLQNPAFELYKRLGFTVTGTTSEQYQMVYKG